MDRTYFLAVLVSGMALLLFPAHAERNVREKRGESAAKKEMSDSVQADMDREPDAGMDVDMDVESDMDVEEPQVDMDADRDEPDMDADSGQEDVDREEIDNDEPRLTEHEQEKIEKTFTMPAGAGRRTLEIDNVWGSIEVVGTASDKVQLTVNKSIRAESKGKIEQARKDVTLDITQQADALKLYVNGPFRCDCHDCSRSREFEGYIVKMDFQVQVPRDIDIKVKTVNQGRVSVRDINGSFLVRNVNGDIQIRNIAGSGTAHTVNGPVKVSFRQNPREASSFERVNASIELQCAPDLSADFRFKTFNGGISSGFPVSALAADGRQGRCYRCRAIFRLGSGTRSG